jgi:hypothetical protein
MRYVSHEVSEFPGVNCFEMTRSSTNIKTKNRPFRIEKCRK